jgi:hypothetical protein
LNGFRDECGSFLRLNQVEAMRVPARRLSKRKIMKNFVCLFVACGLIAGFSDSGLAQNSDQKINFRELPKPVQKKLRSEKDDIKRIEQFNFNGKTVYEIRIDADNTPNFAYFEESGTRINDKGLKLQRQSERKDLHLKNLPQAVQKTFKQETDSANIEDIDVDTANGKSVFDIDYLANGRNETIRINEDGSVEREHHAHRGENKRGENRRSAGVISEKFDRPLAATEKVNFENVPEPVKRTVREVAGSNRVEDAERGTLDGQNVYEIAFKQNGVHNELRVAEDGSIVGRTEVGGAAGSSNRRR